jgi:epsin
LTLLEFLIKNGSERVIEASRDNLGKIRGLQEFNYYENSIDKGSGVREKAKQIVELLGNNDYIRDERQKARALRNKFIGISNDGRSGLSGGNIYSGSGGGGNSYDSSTSDNYKNNSSYNDSYGGSSSNGGKYSDNDSSWKDSGRGVGGGAYDSNRPSRFSDDPPFEDSAFSKDDDEVEKKSTAKVTKSKKESTGKLKVSIKKTGASDTGSKSTDADLFGAGKSDPFSSQSSSAANFDPFGTASSTSSTNFDPFGTSALAPKTTTTVSQPQKYDSGLDSFMSQPQPVAANSFDPFSAPPAPVQSVTFDPFGTSAPPAPPMQTQNFNSFQQPTTTSTMQFQPQSMQSFQQPQANSMQSFQNTPAFNVQQQSVYTTPTSSQPDIQQDNDFGDFEVAPTPQPKVEDKWASLGGLVDLSNISKNSEQKKKEEKKTESNYSFAGLDGFTKSQSMVIFYVLRILFF